MEKKKKEKWSKPKVVIFVRGKHDGTVLAVCKAAWCPTAGPNANLSVCTAPIVGCIGCSQVGCS